MLEIRNSRSYRNARLKQTNEAERVFKRGGGRGAPVPARWEEAALAPLCGSEERGRGGAGRAVMCLTSSATSDVKIFDGRRDVLTGIERRFDQHQKTF